MIFETLEVQGFLPALKGMRNPMKSYEKQDSYQYPVFIFGENDYKLAKNLGKGGTEHRKYLRMIQVGVNIGAPRYFGSEFDTYKIGTVANSESTMHKILDEEFDYTDFEGPVFNDADADIKTAFKDYINLLRQVSDRAKDNPEYKQYYLAMLKGLLPESFIQKRTICLNYETLANMYRQRKNHRLPQGNTHFVNGVKTLPYNELITGEFNE